VYSIPPNVIEKIIAKGTRTVIQNMTWHGMQEFQVELNLGFVHTERGLTYVELALSGNMVPQFR
jgi:carboxypeptidase D